MDDAATMAHCFAELVGQCSDSSGVSQPEGFDMGVLPLSISTFVPPQREDNRFDREAYDSCLYESGNFEIDTDDIPEEDNSQSRKRDNQQGKVELEGGKQLVQEESGSKKSRSQNESSVPIPSSDESDAGGPPERGKPKVNPKRSPSRSSKNGGRGTNSPPPPVSATPQSS